MIGVNKEVRCGVVWCYRFDTDTEKQGAVGRAGSLLPGREKQAIQGGGRPVYDPRRLRQGALMPGGITYSMAQEINGRAFRPSA